MCVCHMLLKDLLTYLLYIDHRIQISDPIRGPVLPVHRVSVMRTPHVLLLHLTCAPQHGPGDTGVNAIRDTLEMVSAAQVYSFFSRPYLVRSRCCYSVASVVGLSVTLCSGALYTASSHHACT